VLVSGLCLDEIASGEQDAGALIEQREESLRYIYYCAPSFEAFLYRFWLENHLWYKHGHHE